MTNSTISLMRIERYEVVSYLVYIVLLGLFFFSDLAYRSIWLDEVYTFYQVSARSFPELLDSFDAGVNATPYSYFLPLWGIDQLFGLDPASLRFPSLIFAITTIIWLHRILKSRFGNGIAFLACASALLMSADFIRYSHEARPYALYALAALFSLFSGITLVRGKTVKSRDLLVNGLAAFALPSVHYLGIFYSFFVVVAVLFVGRSWGRLYVLKVASSFFIGWALFLLLHLSQIRLIAQTGSNFGLTWIAKPSLHDVLNVAADFFALPFVIAITLVASVGIRLFNAAPVHFRPSQNPEQNRIDNFLFLLALIWLTIPPGFYFFASMGLSNFSVPRYFLPSHLSVAVMVALLLKTYLPRNELAEGGAMRLSNIHAINVGILLLAILFIFQAGVAAKKTQSAKNWNNQGKDEFSYITDSAIPCVTNNVFQFFPYSFYRQGHKGHQVLYFLNKTPNDVKRYKRLDSRLAMLSMDELTQFPAFRFVFENNAGNLFPEFDINEWGKVNGYVITDIGKRNNVELYTARKK